MKNLDRKVRKWFCYIENSLENNNFQEQNKYENGRSNLSCMWVTKLTDGTNIGCPKKYRHNFA